MCYVDWLSQPRAFFNYSNANVSVGRSTEPAARRGPMSLITSKCFTTPPNAIRPLLVFCLHSSNGVIFNKLQVSKKNGAIQLGAVIGTVARWLVHASLTTTCSAAGYSMDQGY